MPMESKLESLINLLEDVSEIRDQSEDSPIVLRHTDTATNRTVAIVCSQVEPINMVLPLNVVWICFKPESTLYRQALQRTSKDPGIFASEGISQSWDVLYFYDDVFAQQTYDPDDLTLVGVGSVPYASVAGLGKVRLSTDPLDPDAPVAIVEGDSRLADNRAPTAHTHTEVPATMLAHGTGHANIIDSIPVLNAALAMDGSGNYVWRQLNEGDLA